MQRAHARLIHAPARAARSLSHSMAFALASSIVMSPFGKYEMAHDSPAPFLPVRQRNWLRERSLLYDALAARGPSDIFAAVGRSAAFCVAVVFAAVGRSAAFCVAVVLAAVGRSAAFCAAFAAAFCVAVVFAAMGRSAAFFAAFAASASALA